MEIDLKKYKFLKKNKVKMEKNVQKNLLDEAKQLPFSRTFLGFYFQPVEINKPGVDFAFIWKVYPLRNPGFMFFFPTLHAASMFARKYSSKHSDAFWSKIFLPMYSYDSAVNSYSIGDNWR